jgi:hypothetical protein
MGTSRWASESRGRSDHIGPIRSCKYRTSGVLFILKHWISLMKPSYNDGCIEIGFRGCGFECRGGCVSGRVVADTPGIVRVSLADPVLKLCSRAKADLLQDI